MMGNSKGILEYAMGRGELKECMMGMGKYRHSDKNDPGPYNEESILKGFYAMYEENPEYKANKILENILKEMLDGDIKEIFTSIFYIYFQKSFEIDGMAKFVLDNNILKKINQVVHNRKTELESTSGIEEFFVDENIMTVLRRLNSLSKSELGLSLFQE